ncbi:hypothetical protein TI04_04525 [Achromatium sp. WMS2]|nr:hypothetical protein TI04_04525 [Achromatium sp. WMS2]
MNIIKMIIARGVSLAWLGQFHGFALLLIATVMPLHAETWDCEYNGHWTSYYDDNSGDFTWKVIWEAKDTMGWSIGGEYTDRYGQSMLDGNCLNHECMLFQEYHSGELQGKRYYWAGTYTDKKLDAVNTENTFTGTWGASVDAMDGQWQATGTCHKN